MFAQVLVWMCFEAALIGPGRAGNLKLASLFQGFSFCLNLDQVAAAFYETSPALCG